jgi:pyruvate dehydrogenase E2 component (dihydrolipoamide acetyltransferase)
MIDFVLPSLGADMDQGMLVAWLVEPGDEVEYGQVVAEVETEKGIIEIECWHDGVVEDLVVQPSPTKLPVGTVLAHIKPSSGVADVGETEQSEETALAAQSLTRSASQPRAQPPIRHLAHTLGVDVDLVTGTGVGGSITREDVKAAAARPAIPSPQTVRAVAPGERVKASPRARALARDRGAELTSVTPSRSDGLITYADIEVGAEPAEATGDKTMAMRRAITRSMTRSDRSANAACDPSPQGDSPGDS